MGTDRKLMFTDGFLISSPIVTLSVSNLSAYLCESVAKSVHYISIRIAEKQMGCFVGHA